LWRQTNSPDARRTASRATATRTTQQTNAITTKTTMTATNSLQPINQRIATASAASRTTVANRDRYRASRQVVISGVNETASATSAAVPPAARAMSAATAASNYQHICYTGLRHRESSGAGKRNIFVIHAA
jgi:hypothetical protein